MTEPRWPALVHVPAIHSDQIKTHGGSAGLRDRGLLESALERPRNQFHHGSDPDLASLAAAYGFGLANDHPFVDGNKCGAFQAMYLFLGLNGFRIEAPKEAVVSLILCLAAGEIDETELADWVREHITRR